MACRGIRLGLFPAVPRAPKCVLHLPLHSDAAAPRLAAVTYAHLLHADSAAARPDEVPDASRATYALHAAVAQLRRAASAGPLGWAPYIHLGP